MMRRWVVGAALMASSLLSATHADARTVQDSRYNYDLTWNAAVRLIHVDLGFPINERDREAGYLLFTYRDGTRTSQGSVEVVRTDVDGVPGTRVIVQLAQEPTYAERFILQRLSRKLRDEYGEPPAPRPAPQAPPARNGEGNGGNGNGGNSPNNGNGGNSPNNGNGGSGGNGSTEGPIPSLPTAPIRNEGNGNGNEPSNPPQRSGNGNGNSNDTQRNADGSGGRSRSNNNE